MRKIEERMCNAVNNRRSFKESNTEVIVSAKGNVFVKLYNTIILPTLKAGVIIATADGTLRRQAVGCVH